MSNSSAQRDAFSLAYAAAVENPDRILVVDEDPTFVDSVVRTLEIEGFCADQSAELPRLGAPATPPDVLLMELRTVGSNAPHHLEAIRQRPGWSEVPIICIASADHAELRVDALELGANDVLVKPVQMDELVARIRVQLKQARRVSTLVGQAQIDPLTGVLNRRGLLIHLQKTMAHARRSCEPCAVLMLDLDGFKAVNDRFGHQVGDEVLVAVGKALVATARCEDSVARLGGDEFVMVLPKADAAGAARVVERIRHTLSGLTFNGVNRRVRCSVGTALLGPAMTADEAIELADQRMYEDKRRRRSVQLRTRLTVVGESQPSK